MESIGSFFFILVLLAGVLCLFARKTKLGAALVGAALLFLYVIPLISYDNYKAPYYGRYETNTGKTLTIYPNDVYTLYEGDKQLDSAKIRFMNIDDGYIEFEGDVPMTEKGGTIRSGKDSAEVFHKMTDEAP
jgi:hypothetical protein